MPAIATDRRLDKLLHLMVRNATVVVPGPKIASEIGVTRFKVWRWVESLRALGVEIRGVRATGYQLVKIPDILAPSLVRAELGEREFGSEVIHYFRIPSTNAAALRLAAEGAPHGAVVLAEEQTAGRGRLGRPWYSEKSSGIYASIILRPPLSPAAAPALTLMAGVAAQKAIAATTGLAADIRWPNDVLVNGKKVCGILTEMQAEVDRLHVVVLGIGINVNHARFPAELSSSATSLRLETHRNISRLQLLAALLREIERHYQMLLKEGTQPIIARWAAASSFTCGKRVRVVTASGEMLATTAGIDASGALRLRRDDGSEESLLAGEVAEVK